MKAITASQRKSGTWEAKGIDLLTGRRKSFYGKSREEAEAKALQTLSLKDDSTLRGFYFNCFVPTIAFKSKGWQDQIAYVMESLVLPRFGNIELKEITRHNAQMAFHQWASLKTEKGRPRFTKETLNRVKIVFSCVMNLAEADDLILKNPLKRITVSGARSKPKVALSAEELWKLYEASDSLSKPVVLLAGFCSLRIGECCGVIRSAIDSVGVLHVRQQVLQYDGGCTISQTLKTEQSNRMIPLPDAVREALLNAGQVSDVYVCSDTKGGYITPNNATRSLKAACKRAGVPIIGPHALRHTFISLLENELECPQSIVAELSGKAKQGNTANYSHARMEQKRKWMQKLWDRASEAAKTAEQTGLRVSG